MNGDPGARRLLHVDCDMFFVQVARLEDPEGAGREPLLLVGGSADGRGVVTSASYEVRSFGVRSGMPTGQALRLCPAAVVVPVPRGACSRRSREVRAVLERFTPVVEAASIDEFYLDLTGTERLYGGESLLETAERIREAVQRETRIVVSIGGATRRLVAKLATSRAKPDGAFVVPPGGEAAFMADLTLGRIPGIGPVFAETLRTRGLETVQDALRHDLESLVNWLGEGRGRWLFERIRGIDPTPVGLDGPSKSISHERTFSEDVFVLQELEHHLLRGVVELASDIRKKGVRARTIRVYVKDRDFRTRQVSHTVADPIESDRALHRIALPLLHELWSRRSVGVRLLGVGVINLTHLDGPEQMRLLEPEAALETDRDRRISRATDALRARFGADALRPGSVLRNEDRD